MVRTKTVARKTNVCYTTAVTRQPSYRAGKKLMTKAGHTGQSKDRRRQYHQTLRHDLIKLERETEHDVSYAKLEEAYCGIARITKVEPVNGYFVREVHKDLMQVLTTGLHRMIRYRKRFSLPLLSDEDNLGALMM